ncbi:MAG: SufD family Fe-S cluster assembly protein [Candidatus Hadarchaeales archaeon]
MRDLSRLKEIEDWFAERERGLPDWWREQRERARKIFREKEERGEPAGKYGADFDLLQYLPNPPPKRALNSLEQLGEGERRAVESVGMSLEEERAGSHLQEDATVTYKRVMEGKGVLVETPEEAVLHYPWLKQFVHGLVPIDLDKYTAFCSGFSLGGAFIWVKEGAKVDLPLQACFMLETERVAQLPYILVLASPNSKINILSGCTLAPSCQTALHGCVTEIYVGRGAEVTFNLVHHFRPGFHVRPKVGVMVEEGGTYIENYMELGEPSSSQLFPTVILRGRNSRAELRSFFFGRGKSDLDIGGGLLLVGEGSRGEVVSRAVVTDEARVRMRGMLKGYGRGVVGHLECRGLLLSGRADVRAFPNLSSLQPDANLTHEAAVGRIEEEHLNYLMSRGIPRDQATSLIISGFLDVARGLPEPILAWMKGLISRTARELM